MLVCPVESLFFVTVTATAASAAAVAADFLLERFFVEVLVIDGRLDVGHFRISADFQN